MMPYHRIAARLYNKPMMLAPDALMAASDFLLSRVDRVEISAAPARSRLNKFAGERFVADPTAEEMFDRRLYKVTSGGTAIITIVGELCNRSFGVADFDCGLVSYEFIRHQIDSADKDGGVGSILLDLDSPGGESNGCFSLGAFIRSVRARKPIVAFVNSWALSGGYEIAAAARWIVAPRDSQVGSIGTWTLHFNLAKHFEQQGVKPTLMWRGARKVDGHPFGELEPDARAAIDSDLDRIYAMFVSSVAEGRPSLSEDAIRATEAACYYGEDALRLGLIDRIGTFEDALALAESGTAGAPPTAPKRAAVKAPVLVAASPRKNVQQPKTAKIMEGKMELCATDGCGHPHQHPDDGPCTAEGCSCQAYVAPAVEGGGGETQAQRIERLESENRRLLADNSNQARQRISAEVAGFMAPLQASSDLRFNVQEIGVLGELLIAGKCAAAGLTSAVMMKCGEAEHTQALDVKSLGAFVVECVGTLSKVGAKFTASSGELPAPKVTAIAGVTLADFHSAALDTKAGGRIVAAVKARRKETKNSSYSKDDLFRELSQ